MKLSCLKNDERFRVLFLRNDERNERKKKGKKSIKFWIGSSMNLFFVTLANFKKISKLLNYLANSRTRNCSNICLTVLIFYESKRRMKMLDVAYTKNSRNSVALFHTKKKLFEYLNSGYNFFIYVKYFWKYHNFLYQKSHR